MEHLIDKDAVVAEIERIKHKMLDTIICERDKEWVVRTAHQMNRIIMFLDTLEVKEIEENKLPNPRFPHLNNIIDKVFGTGNLESFEYEEAEQLVLLAKEELLKDLEVKEVDLDSDIRTYLTNHFNIYEDGVLQSKKSGLPLSTYDIIKVAKHFFELGLNTQHSSINIPNIDDILEESGIDPYSKEAKIFKESYYMALEKLKAQKGKEL